MTQRGMFDFLRTQGEAFVTQVTNRLMGDPRFIRAVQTALKGKEWFGQAVGQAVAQALRTMNVPTRTEFKRALLRIEALEEQLAQMRKSASAARRVASRPRGSAGARKKGARKRAAPAGASSAAGTTPAE